MERPLGSGPPDGSPWSGCLRHPVRRQTEANCPGRGDPHPTSSFWFLELFQMKNQRTFKRKSFGFQCGRYRLLLSRHPESKHLEHCSRQDILCIWENALLLAILSGWKGATVSQNKEEKDHMEGMRAVDSLRSAQLLH